MSKVTILTKPNRIVIASKGVQGPPGPQGEQGIQGPKGDTGDVTPEALAARDAAVDAADAASQSADAAAASESAAGGSATTASAKADEAAASADLAEQARLLGATIGFATKADMDASLAHPDGTLALVTSDATASNNGTYRKTGASGSGAWVQSADRVTGLEGRVGAVEVEIEPLADLSAAIDPITPASDILVIADNDGKAVAKFDSSGALNLPVPPRFSVDEEIRDSVNRTRLDPDSHDIYVLTDADGKILFRASSDGELYGPRGLLPQDGEGGGGGAPDAGTVSAHDRGALPYKRGQTAAIVADSVITHAIQHTTTIYGYEDPITGVPRSKVVTNGSLTHPKVLWIPGGWNGYEYWMAVTPYYGESWGSESENPHILASNDQINWQEIPDGPLDIAPEGPDYYSDTHLTLGDDGFLYCTYRGYGTMVGGEFKLYTKRSRDGVNWGSRTEIVTSHTLSPVLEPAQRGGFDFFVVGGGVDDGRRGLVRNWTPSPTTPMTTGPEPVEWSNRPWETEHPRDPSERYEVWHFDAARVGNLYVGVVMPRVIGGSGPYLNYLCWSADGWLWHAIPGEIGSNLYRSSIVPVSFTQNRVICDVYLAHTTGVISVRRFTLEFS